MIKNTMLYVIYQENDNEKQLIISQEREDESIIVKNVLKNDSAEKMFKILTQE